MKIASFVMPIQSGDSGGEFEYCPGLRTSEDEKFAGVTALLDGESSQVKSLTLGDGDLQIFRGRYALHRVTAVEGARTRYVGIFSFADEPGMVARAERCKQLYGRVLPIHLECEQALRTDLLAD